MVWVKMLLRLNSPRKGCKHFLHSEFSEEEQCKVIYVHVSLSREGTQVIIPLSTHLVMILVNSPNLSVA